MAIIAILIFFSSLNIAYSPTPAEWFNASWQYRVELDINSSFYARTNWPVEVTLNFTQLLQNANGTGTIDSNTIRVVEYSSSGFILYEINSQFDPTAAYNNSSNAIGELTFIMNGSTSASTTRRFFVYFDVAENGAKTSTNYVSALNYTWDGEEFNVNNSLFEWYIDTVRGENTSGIYWARGKTGINIFNTPANERPVEYLEYYNGSQNLTFDLRNNASFTSGPVRIIVEQTGNETVMNSSSITNRSIVKKTYTFYANSSWIKIEQNITNIGNETLTRNSTLSGALTFDAQRAFGINYNEEFIFFNDSDPGTWSLAIPLFISSVGFIQVNETNTQNFSAVNNSITGRVGINLYEDNISVGSSITDTAIMLFNTTDSIQADIESYKLSFLDPVNITILPVESWVVNVETQTNTTTYNRGENVLITSNTNSTYDVNNITYFVNTTLDKGTPTNASDNQTLELNDIGNSGDVTASDETFSVFYNITTTDQVGTWSYNISQYNSDKLFLNQSNSTFNVTHLYQVDQVLNQSVVLINLMAWADFNVTNFLGSRLISGANITCDVNGTAATNITDWNNGSYTVNFTNSANPGTYTLNCTAQHLGNIGYDGDDFEVEDPTTNVTINLTQTTYTSTQVNQSDNENFNLTINVTNIANATATNTNITFQLPTNITIIPVNGSCSDINISRFCSREFNITIANKTTAGNYTINITANWLNADNSPASNQTNMTIVVQSNPVLNVSEILVSNIVGEGEQVKIGNFTAVSIGNADINNITYSVSNLSNFTISFNPVNLTSLAAGTSQQVEMNLSAPLGQSPGTYTGVLNITSVDGGSYNVTVQIQVPGATNITVIPDQIVYTSSQVTQIDNQSFNLTINVTNTGNTSTSNTNVSLTLPTNITSDVSSQSCSTINASDVCSSIFNITIANKTTTGNYTVDITVNWSNADNTLDSNQTTMTIVVQSNPAVNISETSIAYNVSDGTTVNVSNFTVLSIGNDNLTNITYSALNLGSFTVTFNPMNITNISAGENQTVQINVSVPPRTLAGTYNGTLNVTTVDGGYVNISLQITVPENRSWIITPSYCQKVEVPDTGIVCQVEINNTGNAAINFTLSPSTANYTSLNETNFTINAAGSHWITVLYNVSDVIKTAYNATYTISSVQNDSSPLNNTIDISLVPFILPDIYVYIQPNSTGENETVNIYVNVTDQSDTGINWTKVNITRPDNTVDEITLNLTQTVGNVTVWYTPYPNTTTVNTTIGNTTQRGTYFVNASAQDNSGAENTSAANFNVNIKLNPTLIALSAQYFQGGTGTIYYKLIDFNGSALVNANVTINITDSNGNVTFLQSYQTDSLGLVTPQPQFVLASDAPIGNYSVSSYQEVFDNITNVTVSSIANTTFEVAAASVGGGLFADIATTVVWYPNNIMKFDMIVKDSAGNLIDPDSMILTVLDPADNTYFEVDINNMTKEANGFYSYTYAMPVATATGAYLAILNVTEGSLFTKELEAFRVASGGPFDLILNLLEPEVYRADYLDFEVKMINMGEVSQDVLLEYWVTSNDNTTWDYQAVSVFTSALQNQTITRSSYTFSTQSLGLHTLNARLTFDNVQAPVIANATFNVVQSPNITIPDPEIIIIQGPDGSTTTEKQEIDFEYTYNLSIVKYPKTINQVVGWTGIETIEIKNTGTVELNNISFYLIGLPSPWFKLKNPDKDKLNPAESYIVTVEFNIPRSAEVKEYDLKIMAVSTLASDSKETKLTLFPSEYDLIEAEIRRLRAETEKLAEDTRFAEEVGKDVSNIYPLIEEIISQLNQADQHLQGEEYQKATDNLVTAAGLIEQARQLLIESGFLVDITVEAIPFIYIIIIVVVLVGVNVFLLVWIKGMHRDIGRFIRPDFAKIKDLVGVKERKEEKNELKSEREKIRGILRILEKEFEDGIISKAAYEELKKNHEKKLKEINKKLK